MLKMIKTSKNYLKIVPLVTDGLRDGQEAAAKMRAATSKATFKI